jgi:hypothetical protein
MARPKSDVNRSEEIRKLLTANPDMPAKDVVATLGKRGIKITDSLVYLVRGRIRGRKGRRKKARQFVAKVAATGNPDPVATVLKVKRWAGEVGGLKKLKALVDVLSE